jgi:hypothetical protein
VDKPEPEGGWENFNRYLDSSLMKGKESNAVTGNVELEFQVDRDGKPINFKSINTAPKELETKAVELIKKGPRWRTSRKNGKANVTIKF